MTTFGIEIEITNELQNGTTIDSGRLADVLRAHGIDARAEGYNHTTRPHWKVITDSSCGLELVSPPLDPDAGDDCWEQIVKVCTALNSIGATVDRRCGLHVHLYVANKTPKQVAKFAGMYFRLEHLLDLAMPRSRRGNANSYCKSNVSTFRQNGVRAFATEAPNPDTYVEWVNAAIAATRKATTMQQLTALVNYGQDRYFKLNLTAFARQGTIEVRHHAGTTNAAKITMWVRFLLSMMRRAEQAKFVRDLLTTQVPAGNAWHLLWALDDIAACAWLKTRIERFAQLEGLRNDEDAQLVMQG